MPMRKKSIAPLITAASALCLGACSGARPAPEPAHPPMLIDSYHTPTSAELYAERYRAAAAQVAVGATVRFIRCGDDCPGATPKTAVADVHAAVARALKRQQRTGQTGMDASEQAIERRTSSASAPGEPSSGHPQTAASGPANQDFPPMRAPANSRKGAKP